jgi:hypothetical protein
MKRIWSLVAATALVTAFAGTLQAQEPTLPVPADLGAGILTPALQVAPPNFVGTKAICQVGSFQYNCKEIWGTSQGRCGANTWRYTFCKQYKNSAGKWYYQECGPVQEVCSAPGGAECIPCL